MKYTIAVILLSILSYNASGKLLVFLIDGLRYDYLDDLDSLPGFWEIIKKGVKVDYLTPEYPSLTYPNLYSLMTGKHTETHHMTGNYMWDMESDKEFNASHQDGRLPLWWEGAEPLWVTMEKLSKSVYMYNWPGCEVEILGVNASYCQQFNKTAGRNLKDTLNQALDALKGGEAEMAAVYYLDLDTAGHYHGPLSYQTNQTVFDLDRTMQFLNKQIMANNMTDDLNIIMFSDHGMLGFQGIITLDNHTNMSDVIKVLDIGAVVSLWPKQEKFEEIFTNLSAVENMITYRTSDIPVQFNYKEGRFVSTLTLVAKPGWIITPNMTILEQEWGKCKRSTNRIARNCINVNNLIIKQYRSLGEEYGAHGYDNELVEMRGFFVAKGPDFKSNFSSGPIRAVDVYNVMCHALGIDPLPNNGSFDRVRAMLNESSSIAVPVSQQSWLLILLGLSFIF